MTNDQIQQWADKAGFTPYEIYPTGLMPTKIRTFAALVRNATLEEAAVKCDELVQDDSAFNFVRYGAYQCSEKIRSMKA